MGFRNWLRARRERKMQAKLLSASNLVISALTGKATEQLQSEGGWEIFGRGFSANTSEAPWQIYSDSAAEKLYVSLSIIYACTKKIADTAGVFTYTVVAFETDDKEEEFPDHPQIDLLEHPNDKMSYADFMFNLVMHLELTGVSYVWKSRNQGGFVDGLWPFPTSWVSEKTDKIGNLLNYRVERDKFELNIKTEDMIIFRYPNPGNPLQPSGPVQACFKDAQIDEERADYMIEMLENMHLPGPVFSSKESWTEDQMNVMRRMVRDKIGKGKRASPLFVGGEDSKVEMVDPLADMDWPGTAALTETRICATLEVPPILIHLRSGLDRSTYSNYGEAKRAFYNGKMIALTGKVADGLSLGLLHSEGDVDFWFKAVTDDIPELQEDIDKKHDRARKDFHAGGLTLDEYLSLIGQEPVEGRDGEMRLLPVGVVPFYPNEEIQFPTTEAGTEEEEEEGFETTEEDEEDEEEIEEEEVVDDDETGGGEAATGDEDEGGGE